MIPPVPRRSTQNTLNPQNHVSLRVLRVLRAVSLSAIFVCAASPAFAHDVERTQVLLSFARDGSFTLDVSSDPNWLKLRLQRYDGNFIDRVVLFVDGAASGVLLDTLERELGRYSRRHFYVDARACGIDVVAVDSRRWCFDPIAHRLR